MIDRVEVASLLTALCSDLIDWQKEAAALSSPDEAATYMLDCAMEDLTEILRVVQQESHCCGGYKQ